MSRLHAHHFEPRTSIELFDTLAHARKVPPQEYFTTKEGQPIMQSPSVVSMYDECHTKIHRQGC